MIMRLISIVIVVLEFIYLVMVVLVARAGALTDQVPIVMEINAI